MVVGALQGRQQRYWGWRWHLKSMQSIRLCLGAVTPQSITCVLVPTRGLSSARQYIRVHIPRVHTVLVYSPVLQLLCVSQVNGVELDGLGVVLHESECIAEAVARLSHKCGVVYLPCHRHGCPVKHINSQHIEVARHNHGNYLTNVVAGPAIEYGQYSSSILISHSGFYTNSHSAFFSYTESVSFKYPNSHSGFFQYTESVFFKCVKDSKSTLKDY